MTNDFTAHLLPLSQTRIWAMTAALAILLGTGCQSYQWRDDYLAAESQARREGKYLFVYYTWWLDATSARMESETLNDQEVQARFKDTINLKLDRQIPQFEEYMRKYRVSTVPACVLVAPDESYQVRLGLIPKERFLGFVDSARRPGRATSAPVP